ncbi:MAG: class I SAM-dependent methyltransferase [Pseudomonadales bacterium]
MDTDNAFEDPNVVDRYRYRPDYPKALYRRLTDIARDRHALLDLGCGPGKISRTLAAEFDHVDAVDPSPAMQSLGRSLPGGTAPNLSWIRETAEEAELRHTPYGLIVAGASIHWMDQARLFKRLGQLTPHSTVAIVDGDSPHHPPWQTPWHDFMLRWIPRLTGLDFGAKAFEQKMRRFTDHIDVLGDESFDSEPIEQSVEDFIACQHSRKTFTYRKLGQFADEFDAELHSLLAPYSQSGVLTFRVRTQLTWGTIRKG